MPRFIFIMLPLVAAGIVIIWILNNISKKNKKKTLIENKNNSENLKVENEENTEENYMATGMSLGMCFGVAAGSIFMQRLGPNALTYGICFGMLGGMVIGMNIKKV